MEGFNVSAKQDRQGVRTAADIERKYNLSKGVTQEYVQSSIKSAVSTSTTEIKNYANDEVDDLDKRSVKTVNGSLPDADGAVLINTQDLSDEEISELMAHML
jgi:hypothetical protein